VEEARVDPNAAPWRSLDTEAPAAEKQPQSPGGIPLPAVAAAAGAVVLAGAAFLLAMGSGGGSLLVAGGAPLPSASGDAALQPGGRSELVVEIVGAVTRPGVYRLQAGTRIGDLVDAAGGYNPRVDVDRASRDLNLAALLADGDQVRVPSRDDAAAAVASAGAAVPGGAPPAGSGGLLDLNAATSAELETLPGVGPATAGKIIAAREEQPFTSVDELRSRGVLGEKTFEKVRDLVVVH
jgi:competence protein ComEA